MEQLTGAVFQYLSQLGGIGLFVAVFIDALGIPFPGGLMIVMSGFLIQRGDLGVVEAVLAVVTGYLSGAVAAYFVGKHVGYPTIKKYGRYLKITPEGFKKGQQSLKHSAAAYLIIGRFIPAVGNIAPYMAGISGLKIIWFVLYSSVFALLWGTFNLSVGYIFGRSWHKAGELIGTNSWLAAGSLILLYFGYKYYQHKKLNKNFIGGE
ncbi:membrane protein DedA with SNARE-associated domain [Desulfohalotomaculum tongense]|uniref:DedA family protein n=1 Tax=Desulforadius tongensis TaxID=1216062 RepID=UPI00195E5436|nr:DedA family protein [Desulforadius tongensis]MBM7855274.1 membrane protein DedA with SNARE-associated domain [Desulforadius tongensis]